MRADAAKNREHILAVARDALREAGDASLIGIARRAASARERCTVTSRPGKR